MQYTQNASLKNYSTMRLGGTAAMVIEITSRNDLQEALAWAEPQNIPIMMIGGGSNIVWRDEGFPGVLLVNKIKRYDVMERDTENVFITVGAGEDWDSVVKRTVDTGLSGIEALSLIPGTAGATPIQNVGAYGQEIANSFVSAEVYDRQTKSFTIISKAECEFSYRNSIFKTTSRGRYFILALTLHLQRKNPEPPFYQALERYFSTYNITNFTPQTIRNAVIDIRSSKLPDPSTIANNGSFFANPIVEEGTFVQIQAAYPTMPFWRVEGGVKLSAAWLIEQAGLRDYHDKDTGMATWYRQPLVFVNEHAQTTAQLLAFKQKVVDAVKAKFDVTLVQEPELLP